MSSLTVKFKSSVFFLAAVVGAGKVLISFNKNNHLDDGDPYSSISTAERHECSQTERVFEKSCPRMMKMLLCLVPCLLALTGDHVVALSLSSSSLFLGSRLSSPSTMRSTSSSSSSSSSISNRLTMRKQKASDRRTRRRQRGLEDFTDTNEALSAMLASTFTVSPMKVEGSWKHKTGIAGNKGSNRNQFKQPQQHQGGRGRSRKRRALYNSLAFYHNHFLNLLTSEYKAEVRFKPMTPKDSSFNFLVSHLSLALVSTYTGRRSTRPNRCKYRRSFGFGNGRIRTLRFGSTEERESVLGRSLSIDEGG